MGKKDFSISPDDAFAGDLQTWLPKDLMPGEKVLWIGRPKSAMALARLWWPGAILGLIFCLLPLILCVSVLIEGVRTWADGAAIPPFDGKIIGPILFSICAGIVVLSHLSVVARIVRNADRVRYVLTDVRLVMLDLHYWGELTERDMLPGSVREMWCIEHHDGSGDLVFETRPTISSRRVQPIGIFAIENVRSVESMVRKTLSLKGDGGISGSQPPADLATWKES